MPIPPNSVARALLALSWLTLFLAACSLPDPAVGPASPATALRPGTLVWGYQGAASVLTVAWSPDGHSLALGEADGTVQVCDALTGTLTLSLRGQTQNVWALAWSPDGKRLASVSWDSTVRVWDSATGRPLLTYRGHAGEVLCT